jgi:eukaryotic-like serine/threonine-protein kinase
VTDPARRQRVEELCDAALSRTPAERAAFLAAVCGDDPGLRREVDALLAHAQTAERFLAIPLGAVAADVLTDEPLALAGRRIGEYRILSLLGSGGMGEVYRARDMRLGRDVALKILSSAFTNDPERLARFEREARVLAALNHPNIATIHGIEESPSTRSGQAPIQALVMELVEGPTLADRIAQGPTTVDEALPIARQIAEALEAAHEQSIIHRDLKPANIKLRPDGTVKVLDFGLAKIAGSLSPDASAITLDGTREGQILGTAAYMSPEQARGQAVDKRSDIWAFGCVLYEMLTGRRAFVGDEVSEVLASVLAREPDWALLPRSLSPVLVTFLKRCLHKDRRQRIGDAQSLRLALEGAFETVAQPAAVAQRPGLRALWVVVAAILVVLTTGLVTWSLVGVNRVSSLTPSRFVITPPENAPLANQPGLDVIISPDGRRIAYLANDAKRGRILFVRDIDGLEAQVVPGTENAFDPFFSPDGAWIGFERGTALMKVAVAGGAPLEIVDAGAQITGTAWGVDDTLIFARFDGLYRVPATGGSAERLARERQGEQYLAPRFLPGENAVLFHVRQAADFSRAHLGVLLLETGEQRILIEGAYPYYVSGHVVFTRGATLMAAPFNIDRLEVTGSPVAVMDIRSPSDYAVSETTMVYVSSADATTGRTLTWVGRDGGEEALAMEPRNYANPRVSPDGGRVAVSAAGDIWIHDVARGTTTRLTLDPASDVEPLWTPDGARVVFSSNREGSFDVYGTRADGTGTVQRLTTGPQHEFPSAWGNDGQELVFMDCRTPQIGLCDMSVVFLDGERQSKVLLQTEFNELFPTVSPDGRWLAYESNTSGRPEIYLRPYPDVEGGLWQVSTGGGMEPLWAPEANELFYRTPTSLMVIPMKSGATPTLGKPQALFNLGGYAAGRNYDISPKGDRIIAVPMLRAGGTSGQIVVVQNWQEELKRLVPTN